MRSTGTYLIIKGHLSSVIFLSKKNNLKYRLVVETRKDGCFAETKEQGIDGAEDKKVIPCDGYHQKDQERPNLIGKCHYEKRAKLDSLWYWYGQQRAQVNYI